MNNIVTVTYPQPEIALVAMEDRTARNTFSNELTDGLIKAFGSFHPETKVVIIHGYENYFCCGGTQEELLSLCRGEITFEELAFYRLLLDCQLPTISAMQGHALGGGLAFGCYADLIIMAEECLYSTNFMRYGFTPGMGATYIVPKKLGELLGQEMLFSAKNYHGGELKERNAQVMVIKKNEVISTALSLAKELAEKPLISLKILKAHRVQKIKEELPAIIEQEVAMHEITFKLPEVQERVEKMFGQ